MVNELVIMLNGMPWKMRVKNSHWFEKMGEVQICFHKNKWCFIKIIKTIKYYIFVTLDKK